MSQDGREKFGVKSQISAGGGWEKERKERKDRLKAGQSRGSIGAMVTPIPSSHGLNVTVYNSK